MVVPTADPHGERAGPSRPAAGERDGGAQGGNAGWDGERLRLRRQRADVVRAVGRGKGARRDPRLVADRPDLSADLAIRDGPSRFPDPGRGYAGCAVAASEPPLARGRSSKTGWCWAAPSGSVKISRAPSIEPRIQRPIGTRPTYGVRVSRKKAAASTCGSSLAATASGRRLNASVAAPAARRIRAPFTFPDVAITHPRTPISTTPTLGDPSTPLL